ncbi:MAG: hypothetical protein DMG30_20565 [Acidobacteria bacterium]|nr:MAG: hypothetical protein DMG30_20565 [Acidobacteriota bacterium]
MTASITHLLKELKEALQGIYGSRLRGLYLYGSYARGDEVAESDVDVLVVLEQITSYGAEIDFVSDHDWSRRPTSFLASVGDEAIPA